MPTDKTSIAPSLSMDAFSFDDDEGWEDMPVVQEDDFANGLDEEDQKRYHYVKPKSKDAVNATGNLIDFDDEGYEWREKAEHNESEYTRLRITEEEEADEVHLRTKYLFDEDKAMTPLSQMQATKNLLTEAQRVAYVGVCSLAAKEMVDSLRVVRSKELAQAIQGLELWALRIMGRLYYHMELETAEQKMIESLGGHGVTALDLVPSLMTTHTVANPEYDPAEARKLAESQRQELSTSTSLFDDEIAVPDTPVTATPKPTQTTKNVMDTTNSVSLPGISTSLSTTEENVTLDIRWTILCDLFLILIADSVYDSRSRVLLERVASKLGLGWLDVVKFEQRVTEALEIQEGVEKLEQKEVIEGRMKAAKKRRYVMMGLATLGGGLVIGLSAGLLAPVIGAGLGAAFTTIGISGTTGFLAGTGGAAVITTGGVLTGSSIAGRGMARRTQQVGTFELLPLHNNKRLNCIITVPGFMSNKKDDVRLPFSVLDPLVGDVFSVLWEPEMMGETGNALKILTSEVLSQIGQTVLQATVMTALMSALQWPVLLTKLGYLIDNPWSNALDRAKSAGSVLADVLMQRHVGVRPITLIGFSLGARVIFFALVELAKHKALGIVQDVFLLGGTFTASKRSWMEARAVVAGRFVNGYAQNDWILNYLFRATSAGLHTVAGLRPVEGVPGLENVDVTDKIAGHMSYRSFMPLILDQLGFPVSADYFDEPEEPDMTEDRIVVREEEQAKKKKWFGRDAKKPAFPTGAVSRPPSGASVRPPPGSKSSGSAALKAPDDDLPPRLSLDKPGSAGDPLSPPRSPASGLHAPAPAPGAANVASPAESTASLPERAGFDFAAIKAVITEGGGQDASSLGLPGASIEAPLVRPPTYRTESMPPHVGPANGASFPDDDPDATTPVMASMALPPLPPKDTNRIATSDLQSAFTRSLSLNDVPRPGPDSHAHTFTPEAEDDDSTRREDPFAAAPVFSFAGASASADGSAWAPEPSSPNPFSFGVGMGSGSKNLNAKSSNPILSPPSFGDSSFGSPSFGMKNGSGISLSFGGTDGSFLGSPYGHGASAGGGLTFGGADGSISSTSLSLSPAERDRGPDPWSIPAPAKKNSGNSLLGSNPWS